MSISKEYMNISYELKAKKNLMMLRDIVEHLKPGHLEMRRLKVQKYFREYPKLKEDMNINRRISTLLDRAGFPK